MKKAKLLLSLVMILTVVSMVLFACGDNDAHDCKDANFDHKCDVCEKELSICADENFDHKCDVCEKALSICADENSDHKCDVCEKELSVCKDEDNDDFCDICNEYVGRSLSFIKNQDNTYSLYRFDGSRTDVIIPSTYKGLPVTSIAAQAFYNCTSLTSIEIPSSVTSIGSSAFEGSISLTSVVIEDGVTSIGRWAFYKCTSLTIYCEAESKPSGWSTYGNSRPVVWGYDASNLKIIDGVHYYIKDGSAMVTGHNANVTNVTILSTIENNGVTYSVTSIGGQAFYNCTSLRSIVIPSSVTSIGNNAFRECTSLTSIVIPSSVTSIGYFTFYDCTSLTFYCEAESEPSGWDAYWNSGDRPVVWGYSENA